MHFNVLRSANLENVFPVQLAILEGGLFEVLTVGQICQEQQRRHRPRRQLSCQQLLTLSLQGYNLKYESVLR